MTAKEITVRRAARCWVVEIETLEPVRFSNRSDALRYARSEKAIARRDGLIRSIRLRSSEHAADAPGQDVHG